MNRRFGGESPTVADLSMLVARLVEQLRKHDLQNAVAEKAMDYLRRKDLHGSVLREINARFGVDDPHKFAVVCTLDGQDIFDGDCHHFVRVFEKREPAVNWCASQLAVRHPFIKRWRGGFRWNHEVDCTLHDYYETEEDLLTAFQDRLSVGEYFHVFPVTDHEIS